jgi:hypothetical protein
VYVLHESRKVPSKLALFDAPRAIAALMKLYLAEPDGSARMPVLLRDSIGLFATKLAGLAPRDVCTALPEHLVHLILEKARSPEVWAGNPLLARVFSL